MTSASTAQLAQRKALLVTQASLDRMRVTLAVREIQAVVLPPRTPDAGPSTRRVASTLVALALPLLGVQRAARWTRALSLLFAAFRIARHWRG